MAARMGADRRRRIRSLFEEAVEMPTAARGDFLDQACGDDPCVRTGVERLLRADAAAAGFLGQPLVHMPTTAPSGGSFQTPARVGPYQLHEKIGEGGMGTVYRAVRDDEAFQREVAVKLIAHGTISDETRRRLRVERQILAGLNHPWIAQIFDGGTTDEGTPYLVMERVDGEPIDHFCDREELTVRQRLALFGKVCAAVHCSHQNLVVHCDLKPSNILVTPAGDPKLLDFGIAKLLRREATDGRQEPTTLGSRPLTPEYASPEQIRGETLSTASDVYSLGVLLYKLLTGKRPASVVQGVDGEEHASRIVAPSLAATEESLSTVRELQGDLDTIVLKALRSRPEDRFGSAQQLAEDVERYLDGFPVLARQGNFRYRAKKFLRRHRASVAAAAVVFATLIAFAVGMGLMAGRLSRERAKLQEVVDFFRGFFEQAGPLVAEGRPLTLREAVDQNARLIELGLENQPAVKVEIATVLGDIYRELGQPEQALQWSERALGLHRQLSGERSQAYALSLLQVGSALRELGRYEEAETRTRAGLERIQTGTDAAPAVRVKALNRLVSLYCHLGRYEEVDAESAAALDLAEERLDGAALETLVAVANRGLVLRRIGRTADAERLYQRALDLYRETFGTTHPHVAALMLNLSLIQRDRGDLGAAARGLAATNQQFLDMFGPLHYGRIRPLIGLAKLAAEQQHVDDALAFYREAIEVAIESGASPMFVLRPTVEVGVLLLASDRCPQGEQLVRDSLAHTQPHADRFWRHSEIEGQLGECLARQARTAEARTLLERSSQRLRAQREAAPEALRRSLERLIAFYTAMGEEAAREQAAADLRALES